MVCSAYRMIPLYTKSYTALSSQTSSPSIATARSAPDAKFRICSIAARKVGKRSSCLRMWLFSQTSTAQSCSNQESKVASTRPHNQQPALIAQCVHPCEKWRCKSPASALVLMLELGMFLTRSQRPGGCKPPQWWMGQVTDPHITPQSYWLAPFSDPIWDHRTVLLGDCSRSHSRRAHPSQLHRHTQLTSGSTAASCLRNSRRLSSSRSR